MQEFSIIELLRLGSTNPSWIDCHFATASCVATCEYLWRVLHVRVFVLRCPFKDSICIAWSCCGGVKLTHFTYIRVKWLFMCPVFPISKKVCWEFVICALILKTVIFVLSRWDLCVETLEDDIRSKPSFYSLTIWGNLPLKLLKALAQSKGKISWLIVS